MTTNSRVDWTYTNRLFDTFTDINETNLTAVPAQRSIIDVDPNNSWTLSYPGNNGMSITPITIEWTVDDAVPKDQHFLGTITIQDILPYQAVAVGFVDIRLFGVTGPSALFEPNGWSLTVDFGPYFDTVEFFASQLVPSSYNVLIRYAFRGLRAVLPTQVQISMDLAVFMTGNDSTPKGNLFLANMTYWELGITSSGEASQFRRVNRSVGPRRFTITSDEPSFQHVSLP